MEEQEAPLTSGDFFIPLSKFTYLIIGINLNSRRTWFMNLALVFFIFRLLSAMVSELSMYTGPEAMIFSYQGVISTATLFICPTLEFVYLFFNISKLSLAFDSFFVQHHIEMHHFESYVQSTRRINSFMCFIVYFSWFIIMASTLPEMFEPDNWVIKRAFFDLFHLGHVVESIIAYLFLAFETFGFILIPISASLYLTYFNMLHCTKLFILKTLCKRSPSDVLYRLNSLEDLIISFDSTLSILPLHWLFYGLSACLIYFLSNTAAFNCHLSSIVYLFFQLALIFLILASLFIISKKQEEVDSAVDALLKSFTGTAKTRSTEEILARMEKVVKRRVTAWHIFPIDRSLILSYIGSAITFSTLFIQIRA